MAILHLAQCEPLLQPSPYRLTGVPTVIRRHRDIVQGSSDGRASTTFTRRHMDSWVETAKTAC